MQNFYPSLGTVLRYFKQADEANFKNRNVKPLLELLQLISFYSPRIAGHILTRKTAIQSFSWDITDAENPERKDVIKNKLNSFINTIIENYIISVNFGICVIDYSYLLADDMFVPDKVNVLNPINLDYDSEDIYHYNAEEKKYETISKDNIIYFIYNKFIRGGILRTILIPEILRQNALMEWNNLNKLLKGIITSIVDPEKLSAARALLNLNEHQIKENLNNIDTAIAKAEEYNYLRTLNFAEIKTQSIADAKSGASYLQLIEALNKDIAIAYLGQANTTELPNSGGSRAALNVLNLIRNDILLADLQNIKNKINEFLLQFYKINFNPAAERSPLAFDFVFDENEDIETNARIFEYLARLNNVAVDTNEFYKKLNLKRPEGLEDIVVLSEKKFL